MPTASRHLDSSADSGIDSGLSRSPDLATRLALLRRRARRLLLARRRLLAALLAGTAVLLTIQALAPAPPATTQVLVAAHDLPAGSVLTAADLRPSVVATSLTPAGATRRAAPLLGRTTTGPLRAGEPVTATRVVRGGLLAGYPGLVAAPVRIADPAAVDLLRVGDRVDVLAADPQGSGPAEPVAVRAPVLALPRGGDEHGPLASGALVVLAVSEDTARVLAGAGVGRYLSLVLTH